jgi:hypothetical protein
MRNNPTGIAVHPAARVLVGAKPGWNLATSHVNTMVAGSGFEVGDRENAIEGRPRLLAPQSGMDLTCNATARRLTPRPTLM